MLKDKLKELETSAQDRYKRVSNRVKSHIESEIRRVIEKMMKQLLRRARRFSRKQVVDKYMFSCVRDCVDDLFDDMWPEMENEILYALRLQFDVIEEFKKPKKQKRCCLFACCSKIRAAYLYS